MNNKAKRILLIILLVIVVIGGSLLVGIIVQSNPFIKAFDAYFYQLIANMPRNVWLDFIIWPFNNNFIPQVKPYPSFFVVMNLAVLLYIYFYKRVYFRSFLLALVIGSVLASISLVINSEFMYRERPFTQLPNNLSEATKESFHGWTSYPSGHTRDTAMYAAIIASFIPQLKILMIVLAVFVGFSRIYLGVHFPTDVIAGLLLGYLIARITMIFVHEISKPKLKGEVVNVTKPKSIRR